MDLFVIGFSKIHFVFYHLVQRRSVLSVNFKVSVTYRFLFPLASFVRYWVGGVDLNDTNKKLK